MSSVRMMMVLFVFSVMAGCSEFTNMMNTTQSEEHPTQLEEYYEDDFEWSPLKKYLVEICFDGEKSRWEGDCNLKEDIRDVERQIEARRLKKEMYGEWSEPWVSDNNFDRKSTVTTFLLGSLIAGPRGTSRSPVMHVRCRERKTEMFISYGRYMDSETKRGDIRLGDDGSTRVSWSPSTDGTSMFISQPVSHLKDMISHDSSTVSVRTYNFRGEEHSATFNIDKIENALTPIREACGW